MTSIALILLSWNNTSELLTLIESLLNAKIAGVETHLVVVDNGSSPAEVQTLKSLEGKAQVIYSPENRGYAGGNNLGIKHALALGTELIGLMNSDIIFDAGQFRGFVEDMIANQQVGIAGPVIIENDKSYVGGKNISLDLNTRIQWEDGIQSEGFGDWLHAEYVPGTFILVRSQVFRRVGFLDENYFFSGEIADFCFRAAKVQTKICVNKNYSIQHQIGKNKKREGLYLYYNLRNRFLFVSKFYPGLKWKWCIKGSRFALGALLRLNFRRFRTTSIAVLHGMTNKFGNKNHLFN